MTTNDPVEAFTRFAAAMNEAVEKSALELVPPGRRLVLLEWGQEYTGIQTLTLTLDNGTVIRGRGEGKLDAVLDAGARGDDVARETE